MFFFKKDNNILFDSRPDEIKLLKNLFIVFESDWQKVNWFYHNCTMIDYILLLGFQTEKIEEMEKQYKKK